MLWLRAALKGLDMPFPLQEGRQAWNKRPVVNIAICRGAPALQVNQVSSWQKLEWQEFAYKKRLFEPVQV